MCFSGYTSIWGPICIENFFLSFLQTMELHLKIQPTPEGIPVEVYCFTRETDWVAYEAVQGAVFDHLFAVLPDFGLRAYQRSSDREPQSSES